MKRLTQNNINTKEYWDGRYQDRPGYEKETGTSRFDLAMSYIKSGSRVLDIGCGIGMLTERVHTTYPKCKVWGTDISALAIAENTQKHKGIRYHQQEVGDQWALPDDYFDFVFSGEVLEHLDDPHDLFTDAYRVLQKGGRFMVTTPNEYNIQSPEHTHVFTRDDIQIMFESHGFTDIQDLRLPNGEDQLVIVAIGTK